MNRLIIALLLLANLAHAQNFKIPKVSAEQLSATRHAHDTTAPAAVLFKVGSTYFDYNQQDGFFYVTEVTTRLKIYKKEALSLGTFPLRYYIGGNKREKVVFSDAVTYNLSDGKVVKTKMRSDGTFDEKINQNWALKKITLPDVKEGSIIEFTYRFTSPFINKIDDWDFQMHIPVDFSEYKTFIPEYFTYSIRQKGFVFPKVDKAYRKRILTFTRSSGQANAPGGISNAEFTEYVTTYTMSNAPALKDEDYVNNIRNYISTLEHELAMVKFNNQPPESYSTTWDAVVSQIYKNDNFGEQLGRKNYFESDIDALLNGVTSPGEKSARIFNFVKQRMNWNNSFGYFCDAGVRKAYAEKVGNAAEINLMLTAMLRHAGLSANPVLVSTRSNGIPVSPSRMAFNYVICAIEIENDVILLDATSKYSVPNIIPIEALNWTGMLIRPNGSYNQINLMPRQNSKDIINLMATLSPEGKFTGRVRDQYFDYNAFVHRSSYKSMSNESYMERLESKFNGLEIDDVEILDDDVSKPVTENMTFSHNGLADVVADRIYFPPLLFYTLRDNPFKNETREYPVDFAFPFHDKYTFSITIPEGYEVESLPSPQNLVMNKNLGTFAFNITSTQSHIQISCTLDINQAIVGAEDYAILKDFFKKMIEKQNEKVVLKRI